MDNNTSSLFAEIRTLGAAMDAFDRAASRALDINRSDLHALNALEHGPLSHGDLAQHLGLSSGSVTTLVDRLEQAGYVVRQPDPDDRRRSEVALTPVTYQAFARVYRPCGQAVEQGLDGLSESAKSAAASALNLASTAILGAAAELEG
ncbi:MAG: MarR family transcriptional regulator [Actinomycetota bacterium]